MLACAAAGAAEPKSPPRDAKAEACKQYSRQLDQIRERERKGGTAKTMDSLAEQRRRIHAAQFSKGC